MTEAIANNPAFPTANIRPENCGMTLRDYFAAKAMHAFICEPAAGLPPGMFFELSDNVCQDVATAAYHMADAMLKARQS